MRERRRDLSELVPAKGTTVRKPRGETYAVTLELVRKGLSLEEIAEKRDLSLGTIESHFARFIAEGEDLDWRVRVSPEEEKLAADLLGKHGSETLKPIIEEAEGKLSYGQVRIVLAVMEREELGEGGEGSEGPQ